MIGNLMRTIINSFIECGLYYMKQITMDTFVLFVEIKGLLLLCHRCLY